MQNMNILNQTKNQFYELEITDITSEGFGVSKAPDGKTVFVSLALKGERVRAKIIKEYKKGSRKAPFDKRK